MKITPINLAKRVERWQKRLVSLGVGHWTIDRIILTDQMPTEGADASVRVSSNYDSVMFWFRDDFIETTTAQRLDETIIHEWVHVAMRDLDNSLEAVEGWMPAATYDDFQETVDHAREGLVERLARQLYLFHAGKTARFSP